ncbi:hypothetical protein CEUSTIGMA_g2576.t1 [Chlamydomonas eustigma]|uniref:Uncharacterized protein n=1 Tax=Chlamydomonas eustigma TaxID=1157962 RepID=A0A250WWY5_9CHLO|nr:hypothetical protein CEUSTIGMA_g2576.t1 [Chlamydomonas eustigma]|eukprot:GAX75132.1 hypothetical protein CEUSTIGMA_g2576.t1 [Chlamydomonas eustigma]
MMCKRGSRNKQCSITLPRVCLHSFTACYYLLALTEAICNHDALLSAELSDTGAKQYPTKKQPLLHLEAKDLTTLSNAGTEATLSATRSNYIFFEPDWDNQTEGNHGKVNGRTILEQGRRKPDLHFERYLPLEDKMGRRHDRMRIYTDTIVLPVAKLRRREWCGELNFKASLMKGRIYQDAGTSHYFYEPDACRLRRLPVSGAAACLAGKRLVFLGDSISRYHYLSLIHFLASGGYQNPYGDVRRKGNRSVTHVDHWDHDWDQYYKGVVKQINGYLNGRGELTCKYVRHPSFEEWAFSMPEEHVQIDFKMVHTRPSWTMAGIRALKWAARREGNDQNNGKGLKIGLKSWKQILHGGNREILENRSIIITADDDDGQSDASKSHSHQDVIFPQMDASSVREERTRDEILVVMNMCARRSMIRSEEERNHFRMANKEIFQFGRRLACRNKSIRLIWRSCTVGPMLAYSWMDDMARSFGWSVLHADELMAAGSRQGIDLTWDGTHLLLLGLETLNDMLLNNICPVTK